MTEPEFGRVIGAIVTGYDLVSRAMANSIKYRYGSECTIFENDLRVNTTLSVAMFLFSKAIRTSTQNGLKNTIAGWNSEISQMETFLKAAAQSVSNNNSLRKSMALGDYSEISGILNFEIKNFDFDYLSVLDMNGNVVASGNPSHMDNNFGSLSIISNALRGNTTVNYETPANT